MQVSHLIDHQSQVWMFTSDIDIIILLFTWTQFVGLYFQLDHFNEIEDVGLIADILSYHHKKLLRILILEYESMAILVNNV